MSKKQEKENRKNKKALFAFVALFASAAIIIGSAFAFFSDFITGGGKVTAGTLDIVGEVAYEHTSNGVTETLTTGDVSNFNPGDVVYVGMSVENKGNKSAWLRSILKLENMAQALADNIVVCEGKKTYDTCTTPLSLTSGAFTSDGSTIINGTGTAAESETTGVDGPIIVGYTIKFKKEAPNEAQGEKIDFNIKVEAMQYRNNPDPEWTEVTTTEWSL